MNYFKGLKEYVYDRFKSADSFLNKIFSNPLQVVTCILWAMILSFFLGVIIGIRM